MKAKRNPEQVYRLRDLEVQEVSLVDRPANQRKFLIVKSENTENEMPKGTELHKNAEGELEDKPEATEATADNADAEGATAEQKSEATEDAEAAQPEEAPATAAPAEDAEVESSEAAEEKAEEAVKGVASETLYQMCKQMELLAQKMQQTELTQGDMMPPEMAREIGMMARALDSMVPSAAPDEGMMKSEDVEKAGRKMSGRNLAKLRSIFSELENLLGNLDNIKLDEPKAKTEKADVAAPSQEVSALTKAVTGLTDIVRSQGQRLNQIAGSRPTPMNGGVDGDISALPQNGRAWPMDFNSTPIADEDRF